MLASSLRVALARSLDNGELPLRLSHGLWSLARSGGGSSSDASGSTCSASHRAPLLLAPARQQQARGLASSADDQFIGHYTPVTKRL